MFTLIPNFESYLDAPWESYKPFYQDLIQRKLKRDNIHQWLLDWTWVHDLFCEVRERLYVAYNQDTEDIAKEKRYHKFIEEIYPQVMLSEQKLIIKLLESGQEPAGFAIPMRNMRAEANLFREENIPYKSEEKKLIAEYEKISGCQSVTWEGHEYTIPQLQSYYLHSTREMRKQMWNLASQRRLEDRKKINDLWQDFMSLRVKIASNAEVTDYRAYKWQELLRFDYNPEDCYAFHDAIESVVVPAATRIYQKQCKKMGVEILRPWDLDIDQGVYTFYVPPLRPYQDDADLERIASRIFHRVDPMLGDYFDIMIREELLDLHNRKGKAPGGYCTSFDVSKRPFIFANSVGTQDDVQTVLHEAGHAFHVFETCELPYFQQRKVTDEISEVASMAMELLCAPYLASKEGGFYSFEDAARARIEHLERSLLFWPYMAIVDAFQHWVYTDHTAAMDPKKCDERWDELWNRFIPGVDWSGLEEERKTGWHRKIHIHTDPFYYVEYGIAQLGAMQIWQNATQDQVKAVHDYRSALSLGGTVTIPELYEAAGARFIFDVGIIEEIIALIERTISELEHQIND